MVIGREAASFGIPAEGLLQAIRVGVRIFWTACVESANAHDVDPRTLVDAAELIWGWSDDIGLALVRGHRDIAVEKALEVEHERSKFLLGTLQGSLAGHDLRRGAELHGLALEREYVPLRARAFSDARSAAHCERALRHAFGPATEGVLVCRVDGDLVGIAPKRPAIDDPEVVVGLGPAASLERIAPSYGEALRALEAAARFGMRGAFELADLGLLPSVADETSVGERLVARYLVPFRDGSQTGEQLEQTLRAYLEGGLRTEAASRALHVHVNTLRNRLRRIEELIGIDFRDPGHIAELWWALAYNRISQQL
ncbi:MAG TPA: helix-turn-helix domain-containing protein [Solirubrobacteraceae bacterium]|nr:helix-turn-helix domain-containing protein [Solirubrobacteraceae bacterium]